MSTDSDTDHTSLVSDVPQMRAETGYELDESVPPLRFTGYVCLILGLISPAALIGLPAVVIPILAVFFGVIALRPSSQKPAGTMAAKIGMVLAVGFGLCGWMLVRMKTQTLGGQAEYFSRQFIEAINLGHDEFALEMTKEARNRFSQATSLESYYRASEKAGDSLRQFKTEGASTLIRKCGPDAEWVLDRPTKIYHSFGFDRARVVWKNPSTDTTIVFVMKYIVDPNDVGQWNIERFYKDAELIVAESVL